MEQVGQGCHDGHADHGLPRSGRNQEVQQGLHQQHAFGRNHCGEGGQGQAEPVHEGIHDVPVLHDDQDASGNADHHAGLGDICEVPGQFPGDFIGSPAHDEGRQQPHDHEQGTELGKIPAKVLGTIHQDDDAGQQDQQHGFFPHTEGMAGHFLLAHAEFGRVSVNQAFGGILFDFQGVADGVDGGHHNHADVAENPEAGSAHDGQTGDALGHAYGEGVHEGPGVAHRSSQGNDGHTHDGIIAHGNGNAHENGDEGEGFFEHADGGGGETDQGDENGDDGHFRFALENPQQTGHQTVEGPGGDNETDEGVGHEHEHGHVGGVAQAFIDAFEHFEDTHWMGVYQMEGTGHYDLLAGGIGDPVEFPGGQDPGHERT